MTTAEQLLTDYGEYFQQNNIMRLFNIKPFITFDRIHLYLVSDLERVMLGKEKEES